MITAPTASTAPSWSDGPLICRQVQDLTADVRTFLLEPAQPRLFHHDPGQFLTLALDLDGREVERCYTISSPPTRPHLASITVKRVPGGLVSNWLHDHLTPGAVVRARGPLGLFSVARHPARKYLFLSAGSGVTPLMSMTRTLYDLAAPADVVLVHSARTPDDIIFRHELGLIAATSPGIRVAHVGGAGGRLTYERLREIAPDLLEREVFTCGPAGFMAAARAMVATAGLDPARYHEESFTFGEPAATTAATTTAATTAGPAGDSYRIEFTRTGRTLECDAGTPVLAAASRAGLSLPASCAQGLCGTCKTTLVSGSVDMRHNGGIRPREIAQNKILLCCSTPLEDLVLDA